jgi:hypothetical protein
MMYRTKRNRVADRLRLYAMREETMSKASHVRRLTTVTFYLKMYLYVRNHRDDTRSLSDLGALIKEDVKTSPRIYILRQVVTSHLCSPLRYRCTPQKITTKVVPHFV